MTPRVATKGATEIDHGAKATATRATGRSVVSSSVRTADGETNGETNALNHDERNDEKNDVMSVVGKSETNVVTHETNVTLAQLENGERRGQHPPNGGLTCHHQRLDLTRRQNGE